jgi:hypothetical protein
MERPPRRRVEHAGDEPRLLPAFWAARGNRFWAPGFRRAKTGDPVFEWLRAVFFTHGTIPVFIGRGDGKNVQFHFHLKEAPDGVQPGLHTISTTTASSLVLSAKFAMLCHSIASSSQSCFDVGSDDSVARCWQTSAFIRYVSVRLRNDMAMPFWGGTTTRDPNECSIRKNNQPARRQNIKATAKRTRPRTDRKCPWV